MVLILVYESAEFIKLFCGSGTQSVQFIVEWGNMVKLFVSENFKAFCKKDK